MVLLIDTNIVLDILQERTEFYDASCRIMNLCAKKQARGYIAFHSVSNLWYVLRNCDDSAKRAKISDICNILTVCSVGHKEVMNALDNTQFKDFEDCLQDECAQSVRADYIITRNVADFIHSQVKAITPEEFLKVHP